MCLVVSESIERCYLLKLFTQCSQNVHKFVDYRFNQTA